MAVVLTISAPDRAAYEAVLEVLDLDAGPPKGLIVHAACEGDDGGVDVTDVWETAADLDTFFETRLGKAFAETGAQPSAPVIRETFNVYLP